MNLFPRLPDSKERPASRPIRAAHSSLASTGAAVIVVSSDLPEIISISDRVLVMRNGQFISEHVGDDINEHSLVASAMGIAKGTPA